MFEFFEWMRKLGLTCFVVSERCIQPVDALSLEPEFEDFLSDGIIELKMELINNVDIQRRVRCVKMRGTEHSTDYYSLFCNNGYFEIEKALTY